MASRSVNKVILIGHLGKDAETKFTPSGVSVTKFSVATNRRWKDQQTGEWKEETDWANVVLWRQENLANYLTKGKQVYVEGRLQTRSWDDKDGKKQYMTEVVADEVILLGGRGGDGGQESGPQPVSMPRSAPRAQPAPSTGEDVGGDSEWDHWTTTCSICNPFDSYLFPAYYGEVSSFPASFFCANSGSPAIKKILFKKIKKKKENNKQI